MASIVLTGSTKALKTLRFQGFFLASCGALFRWIF